MRELQHSRTFITGHSYRAGEVVQEAAEWISEQEASALDSTVLSISIDYMPETTGSGGYEVKVTIEP